MVALVADHHGIGRGWVTPESYLTWPRDRYLLTPLQLAAKLGSLHMFKHLLKSRTLKKWEWGGVSEHIMPLDEIDSASSDGGRLPSVMDVRAPPDHILGIYCKYAGSHATVRRSAAERDGFAEHIIACNPPAV